MLDSIQMDRERNGNDMQEEIDGLRQRVERLERALTQMQEELREIYDEDDDGIDVRP